VAELRDVLLGHAQLHGFDAALRADGAGDFADAEHRSSELRTEPEDEPSSENPEA
jgi:hypothetical protein